MVMQPRQSSVHEEEEEDLLVCGTTISGSTATATGDNTFLESNFLDIHADDAGPQGVVASNKRKRDQLPVGGDKSVRRLRQFSMKVCEQVESKGRTTYNEVADELVAEFAAPSNSVLSPDQQHYDEKNIRRRVYDALNVLMAMDIISKDKKEIQWKGLPRTSLNDIEELKTERLGLRNTIEKKAAYLVELEEQFVGLQNLIQQNEQLYSSGHPPSGVVSLPFIQTHPHATVEVETSEDKLNSAPFKLHDDQYARKAMKFCEGPQSDIVIHNVTDGGEDSSMSGLPQVPPLVSSMSVRPPTSLHSLEY